MTVSATNTRNDYVASIGQQVFAYTFKVLAITDLVVLKNGIEEEGFDVTNLGIPTGGNVILSAPVESNDVISIYLAMPIVRVTNYQAGGDFLAADVNADFDKVYIGAIQNENAISRSLQLDPSEPVAVNMTLPLKDARKGRFLQFNEITGAPEAGPAYAPVSTTLFGGEGIDIIDNVISIDSTVVTLNKDQILTNKHIDAGNF